MTATPSTFELIILAASLFVTALFFIYGYNCFYLLAHARRYRDPPAGSMEARKPSIAIHLPIYNEEYVVKRLVDACAKTAEDYGTEKVRIMVLDDSNDETTAKAAELVNHYSKLGFKIQQLHRDSREGFKAGALQNALKQTDEDYIAIFDSDFIPPSNFLREAVPYMLADSEVAVVQCKWGHVNRGYNFITRAVSIGMDAHFLIEQPGRYEADCFLNFNGSGGLIRKEALTKAGGWQDDTLTEDLDASYRMQMHGYKVAYVRDLEIPGEITPTVTSFKRQQGRWACGSIQTAKKHLPRLLGREDVGLKRKSEAYIHLTYYLVHPLILASFIIASIGAIFGFDSMKFLAIPVFQGQSVGEYAVATANWIVEHSLWVLLALPILLCTVATWVYYVVSLRLQKLSVLGNLRNLGILGLLGFGISVSNTVQVSKALFTRKTGVFVRTPKYAVRSMGDTWRDKKYQVQMDRTFIFEVAVIVLGASAMLKAAVDANWGIVPILAVYTASYIFIAFLTIFHSGKRGSS